MRFAASWRAEFSFAPVQARYVQLFVLDNWGDSVTRVSKLEVYTRDREGGIASLLEGGASIVAVSSSEVPCRNVMSGHATTLPNGADLWVPRGEYSTRCCLHSCPSEFCFACSLQ